MSELFTIKPPDSLHKNCRAVWVCKRCGNCARHCKHNDVANFHEDLDFPCSGPCGCIDCVPCSAEPVSELFTIKPLEWEDKRGNPMWIAEPLPGIRYEVGWIGNSAFAWCAKASGQQIECVMSPEEGKRLAETHWQEYIKQALTAVTNDQEVSVTNEAQK